MLANSQGLQGFLSQQASCLLAEKLSMGIRSPDPD